MKAKMKGRPVPTSPEPAGRRARRQAETRARIMRAALDLFAKRGYAATKVEQITEAADIGKGTFFNYFPSKEHVLAGFGDLQLSKVEHALEEAMQEGKLPRGVWKGLARALAREPGRSPGLARGLLAAMVSNGAVMDQTQQTLSRGREMLAQLIRKGQEGGDVRSDVNPRDTARLFQQTLLGALLLWSLDPKVDLGPWLDKTFDFFWAGVAVPEQAGARSTRTGRGRTRSNVVEVTA
ncbi:MAG: TetR/AcrR family transcriptional regulator [Terriglobia bacterium]